MAHFWTQRKEFRSLAHSTFRIPLPVLPPRGDARPHPIQGFYRNRRETVSLAGKIMWNWENGHFKVQNDVLINHVGGQTHLSGDQLFPAVT